MTRLRQIAVATAGCVTLVFGLAGCMPERPESISPNAVMETSGDKTLTWTASSSGRLTVWDKNTDKIVYGTRVKSGQSVNVDVDRNKIMLDDQLVDQGSLHAGDQYRLFFEPTSTVESNSRIETNTVETVHENNGH
jgi:hypothetical protein